VRLPLFTDPGSHVSCVVAALNVCPYLAYRNATRRASKVPTDDDQLVLDRPDEHVVLLARGFTAGLDRRGRVWFRPDRVGHRHPCAYGTAPPYRLEVPAGLLEVAGRETGRGEVAARG